MVALGRELADRLPPFPADADATVLGQAAISALRPLLATPSPPLPEQGCLIALQQLVHWPEFTAVLLEAAAAGKSEAAVSSSGPLAAPSAAIPGCPDPIAWAEASLPRQQLAARCQGTFQSGLVLPLLAFCAGSVQTIAARSASPASALSPSAVPAPPGQLPITSAGRSLPAASQLQDSAVTASGSGPRLPQVLVLSLATLLSFGAGWLGYRLMQNLSPDAAGSVALEAVASSSGSSSPQRPVDRGAPAMAPGPAPGRPLQGIAGDRLAAAPTVEPRCLAGEQPEVAAAADPSNFGPREERDWQGRPVASSPALIVLHETVVDEKTALVLFQRRNAADAQQASYHVLIGRDGRRLRVVPDAMRAYGAGDSRFQGLEQQLRRGVPPSVNNIALHVSLVSPADGADGEARGHSGYTAAQYRSLARQVALWQSLHGIGADRVVTHQEVDNSGSRRDPRSLDWRLLAQEHRSQVLACSRTPIAAPAPQASSPARAPSP